MQWYITIDLRSVLHFHYICFDIMVMNVPSQVNYQLINLGALQYRPKKISPIW
jgi:hypothetical protein